MGSVCRTLSEERRRSRPREREDNPEGGRAAYCNLLLSNTLRVVSEPSPTRRLRRCVATVCEGTYWDVFCQSRFAEPAFVAAEPGPSHEYKPKALSPASGVCNVLLLMYDIVKDIVQSCNYDTRTLIQLMATDSYEFPGRSVTAATTRLC